MGQVGEVGSTLTDHAAVMMGTLDFMAPEQALDFHQADIRSDIYALGCTLFYLLAGRPPFAEGTPAQKLLKHQMGELPAIEAICPGLPAALVQVLRRMMAKRPEDRFQTPGEVAQRLIPWSSGNHLPVPVGARPAGLAAPVAILLPTPLCAQGRGRPGHHRGSKTPAHIQRDGQTSLGMVPPEALAPQSPPGVAGGPRRGPGAGGFRFLEG